MIFKRQPMQHVWPLMRGALPGWLSYDCIAKGRNGPVIYGIVKPVRGAFILLRSFRKPNLAVLPGEWPRDGNELDIGTDVAARWFGPAARLLKKQEIDGVPA